MFIGEILANMTQVSDVAPGPLVRFTTGGLGGFVLNFNAPSIRELLFSPAC